MLCSRRAKRRRPIAFVEGRKSGARSEASSLERLTMNLGRNVLPTMRERLDSARRTGNVENVENNVKDFAHNLLSVDELDR